MTTNEQNSTPDPSWRPLLVDVLRSSSSKERNIQPGERASYPKGLVDQSPVAYAYGGSDTNTPEFLTVRRPQLASFETGQEYCSSWGSLCLLEAKITASHRDF